MWKTPSGVVNAPSKTAPGNTSEHGTSASGIDKLTSDNGNVNENYSIRKQQDPPVSKDPKVLNLYLKDETDALIQTMMNKLHPQHMTWLETIPLCLPGRIPGDRHLLNTTTNYPNPISSELMVTILPIRK